MLLSPSSKQSDSTRPSPDQVLEDLEERIFRDRPPEQPLSPATNDLAEDPIHRPPADSETPDEKAA